MCAARREADHYDAGARARARTGRSARWRNCAGGRHDHGLFLAIGKPRGVSILDGAAHGARSARRINVNTARYPVLEAMSEAIGESGLCEMILTWQENGDPVTSRKDAETRGLLDAKEQTSRQQRRAEAEAGARKPEVWTWSSDVFQIEGMGLYERAMVRIQASSGDSAEAAERSEGLESDSMKLPARIGAVEFDETTSASPVNTGGRTPSIDGCACRGPRERERTVEALVAAVGHARAAEGQAVGLGAVRAATMPSRANCPAVQRAGRWPRPCRLN